jgi:hypothetical protein
MTGLFFAERKRATNRRIADAEAFVWPPLSTTEPMAWMNAAQEDWDFLDVTFKGKLYEFYFLVPCPDGMQMTEEPSMKPQ